MSEWGELFARLSRSSDTLDTLRHNAPEPAKEIPRAAPVIAPGRWVEGAAATGEPAFEQPCPERRGLVEHRGGAFVHFCVECGRWGAYGYGCTGDNLGRWYCWLHRPDE
jgi:hypothetical protein